MLEPGVLGASSSRRRSGRRRSAPGAASDSLRAPQDLRPGDARHRRRAARRCSLRRCSDEVGGFEPRIFMYRGRGPSWRLRARGWRVVYRPRLAVVHPTREAHEVKPLRSSAACPPTSRCARATAVPANGRRAPHALRGSWPPVVSGRRIGLAKAAWLPLAMAVLRVDQRVADRAIQAALPRLELRAAP